MEKQIREIFFKIDLDFLKNPIELNDVDDDKYINIVRKIPEIKEDINYTFRTYSYYFCNKIVLYVTLNELGGIKQVLYYLSRDGIDRLYDLMIAATNKTNKEIQNEEVLEKENIFKHIEI